MEYTKLSSYRFSKGKFIAPWNEFMSPVDDEMSWVYGRLPEYLWIALVLKKYGRREGFKRLNPVLHTILEQTSLQHVRMSDFLLAKEEEKRIVFQAFKNEFGADCISPLTTIITGDVDSLFALFFSNQELVEERISVVQNCLRTAMNQHSDEATDIRYVVLVYSLLCGKLHVMKEQADKVFMYQFLEHSDSEMQIIRPLIRSCELMILTLEKPNNNYLKRFWSTISEMTECELYTMAHVVENGDTAGYFSAVKNVFIFLQQAFVSCNPLDRKMKILLGLATYSFRRLEEAETHNLYNAISGRSIVRCMIEDYIMMKYLVDIEKDKPSVWEDFETYGIGQYKLVLTRHRENNAPRDSHVDPTILEAIVNEYHYEEFQDMDTRYFDSKNIREKANQVGEKELYGLYYDYDSAYEHGLWGAIRESALLKCDNPAHQYHCIPNVDEDVVLKSVFPDCVFVLNKTICFLQTIYGIPDIMMSEIKAYEQSPSDRSDN